LDDGDDRDGGECAEEETEEEGGDSSTVKPDGQKNHPPQDLEDE